MSISTARPPFSPQPKGLPTPLKKEEKRLSKIAQGVAFRKAVWKRDEHKSRATGKPLIRSGTDYHKAGEVHHVIPRSLAPERLYDVSNGILLSMHEHQLAEAVCPGDPQFRLLDINGDDDRGQPQRFIWRDADGKIAKERIG